MRPIISYIRVSTGKQAKSGLGIEAQCQAIARFAATEGREVLDERRPAREAMPWIVGRSLRRRWLRRGG
jgi:DNA invertase Pin-like site-specific DNA recombinase